MALKNILSRIFRKPEFTRPEPVKTPADWVEIKYPETESEPIKTPESMPPIPLITGAQLKSICGNLDHARAANLAAIISELAPIYGMSKAHLPAFIAQVAHESGCFSKKEEGLNYSAQRLTEVWPSRFPTPAAAQPYARDSQKLANKVYANRMGNGNEASGDGFRFRGSGFIQLTGRDMHTKYARYKGVELAAVGNWIRTDDRWAMDSALWCYVVEKGLPGNKDFIGITKAINGGTIGLADRQRLYEKAKKVLGM